MREALKPRKQDERQQDLCDGAQLVIDCSSSFISFTLIDQSSERGNQKNKTKKTARPIRIKCQPVIHRRCRSDETVILKLAE